MQKKIFIFFLIVSLVGTKSVFSDARVVGRASRDSSWMSTHPYWSNWAIAIGAMAVATATLIILAKDRDHNRND